MNHTHGDLSLKRVLVTGGAGFIGSHVVARLLDAGMQVGVIDNFSFGHKEFLPLSHEQLVLMQADIRDGTTLPQLFQDFRPDAVVHLAALHFIPYCNQHPTEAADVNIMGTRQVLRCCELTSPKVVFFASTAAVYPISADPNTETAEPGPTDIYGITKLTGEYLAELFQRRTGIRTVVGRLFNAYGPHETNPHVIPEIIAQLRAGQRELSLGDILPRRDFIHVTDLARAIALLLHTATPPFAVFNIGTGEEYSIAEILALCEQILGETIAVTPDPARFRQTERMHLLADSSKLRNLTGWQPQMTMSAGLRDLLQAP